MSLQILFPIKYSQIKDPSDSEGLSLLEQWQQQRDADEALEEEERKRFRYKPFQPGGHRGVSAVFKPEQTEEGWSPGEMSHLSFPIFQYPELMSDPSIIGSEPEITHIEAGPPTKKTGKEYEHYLSMAERFRQKVAESIKIGGQEVPDEYKIDIPDALDIFTESHKSGESGSWLGRAFGGATMSKGGHRLYAYLHPSLISPDLLLQKDTYKKIRQANKNSPIVNLDTFLGVMTLLNRYAQVGEQLRNSPELDDRETVFGFFKSFKEKSPEEMMMVSQIQESNPNFNYTFNHQIMSKIYKFLEEKCEQIYSFDADVRQLAQITGANAKSNESVQSSGSVTEANSFAINNTFRKILSGYYKIEQNLNDNPQAIVSSLIGYISSSLAGDLKKYYKAQLPRQGVQTDADYSLVDDSGSLRTLEDTAIDPNASNFTDEIIERLYRDSDEYKQSVQDSEKYSDALESIDEDESKSLDPDVNIRKKQNIARKSVLSLISALAGQYGIPDILDQWDRDFKEFLINNEVYMSGKVTKALPNLLESIDFKNGIISDQALPCPSCGKTFISITDDNGVPRLEPALVYSNPKKAKETQCRNCGHTTSRPGDLYNFLSIPLLAFLESKKQQYLDDEGDLIPGDTPEERLERKVDIIEEIDRLMSLNHLKVILRGPGRSYRSLPGREPVLIYKNGKMFLQNARSQNVDINKLLNFAELNEMPISSFIAGTGFPVGSSQVGYDRRISTTALPFGSTSLDFTPASLYERNEILNTMMTQELLPILAKDPQISQQLGGLTPFEFSDYRKAKDIKTFAAPVISGVLNALGDMKQRFDLSSQAGQAQSYSELLKIVNPKLLNETIHRLSLRYKKTIPGTSVPIPEDEFSHLLSRAAHILDTIASLTDQDINNLSIDQLLQEDPAAKTDPRYHVFDNIPQFREDKRTPKGNPLTDYDSMIDDMEGQKEKLQNQEDQIEKIMSFVRTHENELNEQGLSLPKTANDTEAINNILEFLVSKGILELDNGIQPETITQALERVGGMYSYTVEIYEAFAQHRIPEKPEMIDFSTIINSKLVDNIALALLKRPGTGGKSGGIGNFYAAIESSPLVRAVFSVSRGYTNYNISDFLHILLVSSSGLFGVAENYEVNPASFAADPETGEPIRFNPPTEDAALKPGGKGQAFDTAYRELTQGESDFPIQRPRFVNMNRPEDPYGVNKAIGTYMLFADQFSSNAIANNPRYQFYLQELSNMPEFQGMDPEEIVNRLKYEITNCVKTQYMDPGSEIFKNDPVTSMRAIASFFVPSDLIDVCLDAWARQTQKSDVESRRAGSIQNGFYQASSILFDIKDMLENGDTSNISQRIIGKYKLASMNDPEDADFFDYINNLLNGIIQDIENGEGCASRALSVIESRKNLQYLSTTYKPSRETYKGRASMANMLHNVNALIRLAARNADNNLLEDLIELKGYVKEELYEEI